MATFSRVSLGGWIQGDDASASARVTVNGGWIQAQAATVTFQISWASQANTIVSQGVTNAP